MAPKKRKPQRVATGRYRPRRTPSTSEPPELFHALCPLCGRSLGYEVVRGSQVAPGSGMQIPSTQTFLVDRVDPKLALPVLRRAYRLVRTGWVQNFHTLFPVGHRIPETGPVWPLWRALATGNLAGEHAKSLVRRVIGDTNIASWESHRYRTRLDVLSALSTAIELCGALAPPLPRRGGWSLSAATRGPSRSTPRKPQRRGVRK